MLVPDLLKHGSRNRLDCSYLTYLPNILTTGNFADGIFRTIWNCEWQKGADQGQLLPNMLEVGVVPDTVSDSMGIFATRRVSFDVALCGFFVTQSMPRRLHHSNQTIVLT